jgi:hypothetical protein
MAITQASQNKIVKALVYAVTFTALLWVLPAHIHAATVDYLSVELDRINETTTSKHILHAVLPSGISAGNSLVITYPNDFTFGASYDYTDMLWEVGSTNNCDTATFAAKTLAANASGTTWGATAASNVVTITSGTDTITADRCVRLTLQNNGGAHAITNPTVTGNTSYTINLSANSADSGNAAVVILNDTGTPDADQVEITASVPPSISLDIDVATNSCGTTETNAASNTINLGSLFPNQVNVSGSSIKYACIDLGTNSNTGVRLLVRSSYNAAVGAMSGPGDTIPAVTADLNNVGVANGYGIRIASLGAADTGSLTGATPYTSSTTGDVGILPGATTAPALLLSSGGPLKTNDSNRITIEFAAKAKVSNVPGIYTDVVTFTALVNF